LPNEPKPTFSTWKRIPTIETTPIEQWPLVVVFDVGTGVPTADAECPAAIEDD
jgi:hypothetical protein